MFKGLCLNVLGPFIVTHTLPLLFLFYFISFSLLKQSCNVVASVLEILKSCVRKQNDDSLLYKYLLHEYMSSTEWHLYKQTSN